jgi:predicted TIM-barrel enzyme
LPIIVGSGTNKDNISELFQYADATIVSTSLKSGKNKDKKNNPNLKSFEERIVLKMVRELVSNV